MDELGAILLGAILLGGLILAVVAFILRRPPADPAERVRQTGLRARTTIKSGEARWRTQDKAAIAQLAARFTSGADALASRLENRVLGLALLSKVRAASREQLDVEIDTHARATLPGQDAIQSVVNGSLGEAERLRSQVRWSLGGWEGVRDDPAGAPLSSPRGAIGPRVVAGGAIAVVAIPAVLHELRDSAAGNAIDEVLKAVK